MKIEQTGKIGPKGGSGRLIIISGPSGVGKGTLCSALIKRDVRLALSVSATTRPPGPGEEWGREYYFYSQEEFFRRRENGEFLEWAEVHGRYYGTLKEKVQDILEEGKDCILEIDVQGGLQVQRIMGRVCIMIFVVPPSEEELIRRITGRNRENPQEISRRMMTARWEMAQEEKYQYTVINDDLNQAVEKILAIIEEERIAYASATD